MCVFTGISRWVFVVCPMRSRSGCRRWRLGVVALGGVVALAEQDGDELGAGGEVGAGLADGLHAAVEFDGAGAQPVAEHAGVGFVAEPGHRGGLDVGGQGAGVVWL